jgi:alpha-N-acetylglucosaminidase
MKSLIILTLSLLPLIARAAPQSPADRAVSELIARTIPKHAKHFRVDTSLPQTAGKDTFSLSDAPNGKILLQGNNGVSVASALNWYLKNRVNCHLSWCGDQLDLPAELPIIGKKIIISTLHKHRVYFNYCTLSYSASFWDWTRWQREIDFMALNGINTPLSVTGLEAVWYHTLIKHGFSDIEAREYLVGPAYFAWQWMTNIESHAGPLPKSWIDSHITLGRQILDRQRALGMTPIQQGFSGCVPRLMIKKFPKAAIKAEERWCNFTGTAQLDPLDPLFDQLGATFLAEQQRLFGSSHLYGCDPFHEGHPPIDGDEYLSKVGKKIFKLLDAHDPQSTWVMQSWSIRKPIATAAPKDRLLVVDLGGSRHTGNNAFWGYPFVSGRLHNFGNRINLHGDIRRLASNPFAQINKGYANSAGMGLFMEGITQNPVYYDLAFDTIWKGNKINPEQWLQRYAHRRYGSSSEQANKAWKLLLETAYRPGTDDVELSSIICARPAIKVKKSGPNSGFRIPYDPVKLLEAWTLLLADAEKLKSSDAYRYDIVDIGRQVLSNHGQNLQKRIQDAYNAKDLKAFNVATQEFHQLLLDVDTLLSPRTEFSLGKWITDARSHGTTEAEKNLYELNARSLVTLWGPIDIPIIFDYSWREWNGLIKTFYLPRWQKFHAHIATHLKAGKPYQEKGLAQSHGREAWRANKFYSKLADWETAWVKTPSAIDSEPHGDALEFARRFHKKYAPAIPRIIERLRAGALTRLAEKYQGKGKALSQWSPGLFTNKKHKPITIPLNKNIDGAGTYSINFQYTSGNARLNISSVELLVNGKVIQKDTHQGYAGHEHTNNIYSLKLGQHAFGTKYTLRIKAKTDGSNNSHGIIFIEKK